MKILMICRYFQPHIGGVEKHTKCVAEILLKKGYQVTVVTEKHEEDLPEKETVGGIEVYRIKIVRNPRLLRKITEKLSIWLWFFKNLNLIKEAEIIHCHDIFFWYLPFRFLFPQKPVYITFHGWEGKFPVPKRFIFARKIWEKLAWGNICVGEYLEKWYGTKANYITYGGINLDKQNDFKVEKIYSNKNKITFIGRFEKEKGLLIYLEAIKILKKEVKNLVFEFVGNGKLIDSVSKIGSRKEFVADIIPDICSSKYIFYSGYLTSMESMFFKRLVFAVFNNELEKDCFHISEFKKNLTLEDNSTNLSMKVLYYWNHPEEEKKLVEKAYRWARGQTWEKVADLYLKLWEIGDKK